MVILISGLISCASSRAASERETLAIMVRFGGVGDLAADQHDALAAVVERGDRERCTFAEQGRAKLLVDRRAVGASAGDAGTEQERALLSPIHRRMSPGAVRGGSTMSVKSPTEHMARPLVSSISNWVATAGVIASVLAASAQGSAGRSRRR